MVSRWLEYRTKNDDVLDENFFNTRFRSVDQRLTGIEDELGKFGEDQSAFIARATANLNAAAALAAQNFQTTLDNALSQVQQTQTDIEELAEQVTDLIGQLGEFLFVDAQNGSTVLLKRSSTPGQAPSTLLDGELYLNYADRKLFFMNSSGAIVSADLDTSAGALLTKLLTVDGAGSGLDADTIDGFQASAFSRAGHTHAEYLTASGGTVQTMFINANSSGPALRVRQIGAGDAFVVEDETGDTTVFRVDANGRVTAAEYFNATLTGVPTAPTAAEGTSTTQVATCAFVAAGLATRAALNHLHTVADVTGLQAALDAKANLASPALTGTPTAPTAAGGTSTNQIATTAFVQTSTTLRWQGAGFTVSTSAPTGGVDGDFWFERSP